MTTVINTPNNGESTTAGFMIGAILVIVIILGLFFIYRIPAMRSNGMQKSVDVNVTLPANTNRQQ